MHHVLEAFLAQTADGQQPSAIAGLLPFVLIAVVFYFLMIRPQQKQRKQLEDAILSMKKGDNVVTTGGVVGEVVHIKETIDDGKPAKGMDDLVTIRTGDVKIVVERRAIARVASSGSVAAA